MAQVKTLKSKIAENKSQSKLHEIIQKNSRINLGYLAKFESELDLYIEEILVHSHIELQKGR